MTETLRTQLDAFERDIIINAIRAAEGHMTRAAAALGVNRSLLYRKMKALSLTVVEARGDTPETQTTNQETK